MSKDKIFNQMFEEFVRATETEEQPVKIEEPPHKENALPPEFLEGITEEPAPTTQPQASAL